MKIHAHVLVFILAILAVVTPPVRADLTPESVAVVVNGDSWASLTIANEYVRMRSIPESNVIVLRGISSFERMNIDTFRDQILRPVFDTLESRGLRDQIDCITYSVDLPTSVNVRADTRGQSLPQVITPVASTNGLTYLHEWVMRKDTDYLRLDINRYSRRVLPLPVGEPLSVEDAAEYQRGMALYAEKDYERATQVIEALTKIQRDDSSLYYNLACCQALTGQSNEAMVSLQQAVSLGWRDSKHMAGDSDLTTLRTRPDFKALLAKMQSQKIEMQPTRGFRSTYGWDALGNPSESGVHYMLSTMLGVTSGRGNSVEEVIACLRRAQGADSTSPRGTVYFLKNGNVRSTTREWAFADAGEQLKATGVRAQTVDGVLPQDKRDVAGALIGTATFDWETSNSTILPGAIVEHLTSCGGMMRERDTQTPCTDFIRAGAAGSSGAVTEPYALQAKFPNAFMQLHYALGSTLAEAYYQSLEGPYQLLIIGDPLCQPWGDTRRVGVSGISRNASLKGDIEIRPRFIGRESSVKEYQLFVDGKYTQTAARGEPLTLDTTAFADGEHALTVAALHDDALETRDRSVTLVQFRNTDNTVSLSSRTARKARFGEVIEVKLRATGASSLQVMHLGRVVGQAEDGQGVIELDTSRLGLGVATLRVIARFGEDTVHGPSFTVDVSAPSLRGRASNSAQSAPAGMLLALDNEPAVPLLDTLNANWLTEAGATEGQSFEITGVFDAAEPGLMQLQLKTNTNARVEIDGTMVIEAHDGTWQYMPVQITPGTHLLRITGTAPKRNPRLDLRLGITGTRNPSDRWLRQALAKNRR